MCKVRVSNEVNEEYRCKKERILYILPGGTFFCRDGHPKNPTNWIAFISALISISVQRRDTVVALPVKVTMGQSVTGGQSSQRFSSSLDYCHKRAAAKALLSLRLSERQHRVSSRRQRLSLMVRGLPVVVRAAC